MKIVKNKKWLAVWVMILVAVLVLLGQAVLKTFGRTQLEFDIRQDQELILFSVYAEPPQFAIWLENPETGQLKTVFVTYRSAQGDWEGKADCPGSLPLWFEVFKREYQVNHLPGRGKSAPIAITGATPQAEHFKIRAEVPPGSEWICWIEVNLAGDFNEQFDSVSGNPIAMLDESGQPAIIYRAKILSQVGQEVTPELFGMSIFGAQLEETIRPVTEKVTTARDIFSNIKIRVVRPKPFIFKWKYDKINQGELE